MAEATFQNALTSGVLTGWCRSASVPNGPPNEDRAALLGADGRALLVVVDGATSIDPECTIDGMTGGAWLAERLTSEICDAVGEDSATDSAPADLLADALRFVATDFANRGLDTDWPIWAWPRAAVSVADITTFGDKAAVRVAHLADCPVYMCGAGPETVRPLHVGKSTGRGEWRRDDGVDQGERQTQRREVMEHQPGAAASVDPRCVEGIATATGTLAAGESLLVLSDGLARAWEAYELIAEEDLLCRIARDGVPAFEAFLGDMRTFEQTVYARQKDRLFKPGDDVSLVAVRFDGSERERR